MFGDCFEFLSWNIGIKQLWDCGEQERLRFRQSFGVCGFSSSAALVPFRWRW